MNSINDLQRKRLKRMFSLKLQLRHAALSCTKLTADNTPTFPAMQAQGFHSKDTTQQSCCFSQILDNAIQRQNAESEISMKPHQTVTWGECYGLVVNSTRFKAAQCECCVYWHSYVVLNGFHPSKKH